MNNQIVSVWKLVKLLQFSLLSIFSSLFPHGLPLLVLLSLRIHYASLHICRFLCEVACLSVKWTMCTHSKHVIMRTRTVLSRTWLKVPSSTEGEISTHSSAGPSSDTTRSDSTQTSSFLCASSSLPSQVWAVYELLWPFSLCLVLFHRLSSPCWSLCFSLRIPCFFYIYYTALEFVCFVAHLSLYIIEHLSLYLFYITLSLYIYHNRASILYRNWVGILYCTGLCMFCRTWVCIL